MVMVEVSKDVFDAVVLNAVYTTYERGEICWYYFYNGENFAMRIGEAYKLREDIFLEQCRKASQESMTDAILMQAIG